MEFFTKFPVMERVSLLEMKKGIDLSFRLFSRKYGDAIENFFDPLLFFLVWLEKLLLTTPWPIIILVIAILAWFGSRSWKLVVGSSLAFMLIGYFGMWNDCMATVAIMPCIQNIFLSFCFYTVTFFTFDCNVINPWSV